MALSGNKARAGYSFKQLCNDITFPLGCASYRAKMFKGRGGYISAKYGLNGTENDRDFLRISVLIPYGLILILKKRLNYLILLVGVRGFEPPATASRKQCSTRLSYTPCGDCFSGFSPLKIVQAG